MGFVKVSLAAVTAVWFAGTALAQSSEDFSDSRCFLAFSTVASNPPPGRVFSAKEQADFQAIVVYYLGKLKGRNPTINLATVVTPAIVRDVLANLDAHVGRCVAESEAIRASMIQIGTLVEAADKAP